MRAPETTPPHLALETTNVAYRTPDAMRHSYASWCLAAGMNTLALARRMGTSVQMIDNTYGHLISDSIERETKLLDDFDNLVWTRSDTERGN